MAPTKGKIDSMFLAEIGAQVDASVRKAVPEAMRQEFTRIGLATDSDEAAIEAQQDFAFLRGLKNTAKETRSQVRGRVISWILGIIGIIVSAGVTAILTRAAPAPDHKPPTISAPQ